MARQPAAPRRPARAQLTRRLRLSVLGIASLMLAIGSPRVVVGADGTSDPVLASQDETRESANLAGDLRPTSTTSDWPAHRAPPDDRPAAGTASIADLRERGAFIVRPLNANLVATLERGFAVAIDHVERFPACRRLFTELGADPIEKLRGTVYLSARLEDLQRVCRHRRAAYTYLGRPHTRLCPAFTRLSDTHAAMILLHEALHFAGLGEAPAAAGAMNSAEINHMVTKHCGF